MGQELQLPDWANAAPASAFAALSQQGDSLSDGIGQSYPVIGYKGKQWSFRYRGERKNFLTSEGFPMPYIDVIILGQAKTKSKSFYAAFDPNNSEGGRPLCSSIDGVLPDPDVQQKQADSCALCPRNQWKQQPNGKKGRDCSDFKRLAVLVLPTQTQPLFDQPILEPAFLRVPAGSLNSLAIMGQTMDAKGHHYASYVTRISFDPNEAHPKMQFRPIAPLTAAEAPVILGMREDQQVERIVHGGFAEGIRTVPPMEGTTLLPPGSVPTGITQQGSVGQAQPQTLNLQPNPGLSTGGIGVQTGINPAGTSTATTAAAQPATQTGSPPQQSAPVNTGLLGVAGTPSGGVQPVQTQQATPPATTMTTGAPPQNSVGDSGAPEATSEDLDSMIGAALGGLGKAGGAAAQQQPN